MYCICVYVYLCAPYSDEEIHEVGESRGGRCEVSEREEGRCKGGEERRSTYTHSCQVSAIYMYTLFCNYPIHV